MYYNTIIKIKRRKIILNHIKYWMNAHYKSLFFPEILNNLNEQIICTQS